MKCVKKVMFWKHFIVKTSDVNFVKCIKVWRTTEFPPICKIQLDEVVVVLTCVKFVDSLSWWITKNIVNCTKVWRTTEHSFSWMKFAVHFCWLISSNLINCTKRSVHLNMDLIIVILTILLHALNTYQHGRSFLLLS